MDLTDNVIEEVQQKEGLITSFLDTLPEKALNLGIRIGLALIFFLHWGTTYQADPQDHPQVHEQGGSGNGSDPVCGFFCESFFIYHPDPDPGILLRR